MASKYAASVAHRLLVSSERTALFRASRAATLSSSPPFRTFSTTASVQKKRKIAPAQNSPPPPPSSTTSSSSSAATSRVSSKTSPKSDSDSSQPDPENPLDFSSLTSSWASSDAHFRSQLQVITHGGRFNPDSLGSLLVHIKPTSSPEADEKTPSNTTTATTFPLRELAQVVPRSGRNISLLVNDKAYIKPIISAVQSSRDFNQQPQRSDDNDLELLMKVEAERKEDVVRRVKECTQGWKERVRQARTRHEKVVKEWKKSGAVLPDVVRKVEKELQKVQDDKMKMIDKEEAQVVKQVER